MKLLPIFFLTFLPIPAQAITWEQFWAPFAYDRPYFYDRPYLYERRYVPLCNRRVYYEDYVPGNYWRSGYVRRWSEVVRVPCEDY